MGIENFTQNDQSSPRRSSSLPLMGIENLEARRLGAEHRAVVVSLPLMGIENLKREHPSYWRTDEAHYPSWGSKTPQNAETDTSETYAHYPSWGSKTSTRQAGATSGCASLPLMGIENPALPCG